MIFDLAALTAPLSVNAIEPFISLVSPTASFGNFRRASCSVTRYRATDPLSKTSINSDPCVVVGTGVAVGAGVAVGTALAIGVGVSAASTVASMSGVAVAAGTGVALVPHATNHSISTGGNRSGRINLSFISCALEPHNNPLFYICRNAF